MDFALQVELAALLHDIGRTCPKSSSLFFRVSRNTDTLAVLIRVAVERDSIAFTFS